MTQQKLSRRTFLQSATAATLAAKLNPASAQPTAKAAIPYPENGTLIPDDDWRLWIDEKAEWKNDPLFLPEDITVDANGILHGKGSPLPINEPTGGWELLDHLTGINVTLPATVEQHHWGKFSHRPYPPEEYRYAADDPIPQNGAYLGVSWWGRELRIPADWKGKRIFLHIRGARLRAEVFLNKKLVGYSIMEELPFECDLTHAADPGGLNLLAIRLTNPFGRYDWVDGLNAQWGAVKLYRSHAFAGLDRAMTISTHETDRIRHAWVLNTANPRTVNISFQIEQFNSANFPMQQGTVQYEILDPETGIALKQGETDVFSTIVDTVELPNKEAAKLRAENAQQKPQAILNSIRSFFVSVPDTRLWDLSNPNLYHLILRWAAKDGTTDTRIIPFGFRWFVPSGLGTNPIFRLNNVRINLYSSISWGF